MPCARNARHPATPSSSTTPLLGRTTPRSTLLANGKVLVVGGWGVAFAPPQSSAELYDRATGSWTTTGSLDDGRYGHTASLLPNGRVLVVGGIKAGVAATS